MTVKVWEAQRIRNITSQGIISATLRDIVLSVIPSNPPIKRSEIIHSVAIITAIDQEDLASNINIQLSALCRQNKIARAGLRGYYCKL